MSRQRHPTFAEINLDMSGLNLTKANHVPPVPRHADGDRVLDDYSFKVRRVVRFVPVFQIRRPALTNVILKSFCSIETVPSVKPSQFDPTFITKVPPTCGNRVAGSPDRR